MALLRNPRFWWAMVLVWFVALFFLSSIPKLPPGPKIPFEDKVAHLAYYSIGAAWFYLARRLRIPSVTGKAAMWGAVLFCAVIGASDEFHQSFVPNRSGNDPWDWLADTLGGFVGAFVGWITWLVIRPRLRHPAATAAPEPDPQGK